MKRFLLVVLMVLMGVSVFSQPQVESQEQTEILISAAASLTDCMNELRSAYMAKNPLVKVTANYGSSGSLQQQIEQGAPADLFFSAGLKQMKALQDKQLMDNDTVKPILENKLVLIIPKNGAAVTAMDDLTKDSFGKIAVGDPKSVPAGQYAQETLKNLGLDGKVKAKLVFAKDVREVLSWVETGNAQVGFVYETDALISKNVTISFTTPEGSHAKVIYPVGVIKSSRHPEASKAFEAYLFSDEAKNVFKKYGFTVI